jgi:hypothetical protein
MASEVERTGQVLQTNGGTADIVTHDSKGIEITDPGCGVNGGHEGESVNNATTCETERSGDRDVESEGLEARGMENWDRHSMSVYGSEEDIERFVREYGIVRIGLTPRMRPDGSYPAAKITLNTTTPYRVEACWGGACDIQICFDTERTPFSEFRAQYRCWTEQYPALDFTWGYVLCAGGVGYIDDTDHCWYADEWGNWVGVDEDAVYIDDRKIFVHHSWERYPLCNG